MNIIELKEKEPLEVIEITKHTAFPKFSNTNIEEKNKEFDIVEDKRIQMRIFTDGEIENQTEEEHQKIDEYYIGKEKYQHDVDTLKTKKIYFKNHSYVIVYLITNELMTVGSVYGWFKVIKDVSIYLENSKDRKSLKCAKRAIREIENHNKGIDYSSIFGMLCSQRKEFQKFSLEEISKNIYS